MAAPNQSGGGFKLSMGHLQALQSKYKGMASKLEKVKKHGDHIVGNLVRTGITAGTAYGLGVLQGRTGGVTLPGGVSLELGLGVALTGLGLFGIGGSHTSSAGNGALAVHFATVGRGQGKKMLNDVNEKHAARGEPLEGGGIHILEGKKKDEPEQRQLPQGAQGGAPKNAVVSGEPRRSRSR